MSFRINAYKNLNESQKENNLVIFSQMEELCKKFPDFSIVGKIAINYKQEFGENLYLRGVGFYSLSEDCKKAQHANWNKGIALNNRGDDTWEVLLVMHKTDAVFKVLINDTTWEDGDNHSGSDLLALIQTHRQMSLHNHPPLLSLEKSAVPTPLPDVNSKPTVTTEIKVNSKPTVATEIKVNSKPDVNSGSNFTHVPNMKTTTTIDLKSGSVSSVTKESNINSGSNRVFGSNVTFGTKFVNK